MNASGPERRREAHASVRAVEVLVLGSGTGGKL
jgi:hypothetical protein